MQKRCISELAIYDWPITTVNPKHLKKLKFSISWNSYQCFFFLHQTLCRAPDTSRVRSKMLYASSKDRFKRELDGIQVELQATDPSEMSMDIVKSRAL
jgi:hypothetical protein